VITDLFGLQLPNTSPISFTITPTAGPPSRPYTSSQLDRAAAMAVDLSGLGPMDPSLMTTLSSLTGGIGHSSGPSIAPDIRQQPGMLQIPAATSTVVPLTPAASVPTQIASRSTGLTGDLMASTSLEQSLLTGRSAVAGASLQSPLRPSLLM